MRELRNKFLFTLTAALFVLTGLVYWVMVRLFNLSMFDYYLFLPVTFYFIGLLTIFLSTSQGTGTDSMKLANTYLKLKLLKFILFLLLVVVYFFILGVEKKSFVVVFSVFYAVYALLEFFAFKQIEKRIKEAIK